MAGSFSAFSASNLLAWSSPTRSCTCEVQRMTDQCQHIIYADAGQRHAPQAPCCPVPLPGWGGHNTLHGPLALAPAASCWCGLVRQRTAAPCGPGGPRRAALWQGPRSSSAPLQGSLTTPAMSQRVQALPHAWQWACNLLKGRLQPAITQNAAANSPKKACHLQLSWMVIVLDHDASLWHLFLHHLHGLCWQSAHGPLTSRRELEP